MLRLEYFALNREILSIFSQYYTPVDHTIEFVFISNASVTNVLQIKDLAKQTKQTKIYFNCAAVIPCVYLQDIFSSVALSKTTLY